MIKVALDMLRHRCAATGDDLLERAAFGRTMVDQSNAGGLMSYQVNFYREIVNSFGKPFNVSVYMAEIETLASLNDAIAAAIGHLSGIEDCVAGRIWPTATRSPTPREF